MNRFMLLAVLALTTACDDKPAAPAAPSAAVPGSAAPGAPTLVAPTASANGATADADLDKADLPVESDFEDEAEKAIDDDSLEANIDKLDKEIVEEK